MFTGLPWAPALYLGLKNIRGAKRHMASEICSLVGKQDALETLVSPRCGLSPFQCNWGTRPKMVLNGLVQHFWYIFGELFLSNFRPKKSAWRRPYWIPVMRMGRELAPAMGLADGGTEPSLGSSLWVWPRSSPLGFQRGGTKGVGILLPFLGISSPSILYFFCL